MSGLVSINVNAADNVGVSKVDLKVNGVVVATDTASPFGFSWDSKSVADGTVTLVAVASDAAGNQTTSSSVSLKVANSVVADVQAPVVQILNPVNGARVYGTVTVSANATDNSGSAGITMILTIDGVQKAQSTGGSLSYSWNTRKIGAGTHTVQVTAKDAAGNSAVTSIQVQK